MIQSTYSPALSEAVDAWPELALRGEDIHINGHIWLWKVAGERLLAAILLVLATPIILLLVIMVRLSSSGPGIFRQVRVGKGGKPFTLYKIRTMRNDAERETGPVWSNANDRRVLPFGKFLRTCHLDELPQLFNVVMGQMNLVGPRPERPEFVTTLAKQVPGYLERLRVKPGVTGLAQVTFGPDTDLESVRRKLALDKLYVDSIGVLLDLRIIVCTAMRFVRVSYSLSRQLTCLDELTTLESEEELYPALVIRPR